GHGEISAAVAARDPARIRELPLVGLRQVRPRRAVPLSRAAARRIRGYAGAGRAVGSRSVSQGPQLRDAELFGIVLGAPGAITLRRVRRYESARSYAATSGITDPRTSVHRASRLQRSSM